MSYQIKEGYGKIYLITNLINDKKYVGQTLYNLSHRFTQHKAACNAGIDYPLYRAFKKYGIKNFSIELLEECSVTDLNNKEQY